jgi:3-hydroxyacyl-CoA dehydrogenase
LVRRKTINNPTFALYHLEVQAKTAEQRKIEALDDEIRMKHARKVEKAKLRQLEKAALFSVSASFFDFLSDFDWWRTKEE